MKNIDSSGYFNPPPQILLNPYQIKYTIPLILKVNDYTNHIFYLSKVYLSFILHLAKSCVMVVLRFDSNP